jgi:hypothetical protein
VHLLSRAKLEELARSRGADPGGAGAG